ncbi:SRPBCC family protein [Ruegeria sp. Ofav3-42]|uniref:SRPBCC family protein n=1 Tax=Ruegeria sp. Ofav3-42 TaxID=2917759 RepID=UPI001EF4A7DC|nr:SRPBCC family protein [Ruegeria sp. Ofav3-42]MCG7520075.1 SRPBCC family protein [Ruegeria sp. Ofav3-42]
MIHHERTLEIDARPEAVWAILSRFMQIDEFAPQVTSVDALTTGEIGVGSKRRCHFENGTSLVEEVTDWQVNKGYRVRLSEMSAMPLTEAHAAITIKPQANSRSRVIWSMDFQMKYGLVGWLMGQTILKAMMGRVLDGNLKALADKAQADEIPHMQFAYY